MSIEKIEENLFCIKIPLPDTPLGNLNAYVIRSPNRSLIIDTGMNKEPCKKTLFTALEALGVDMKRLDIFLTHCHADHVGLVESLLSEKTKLYMHHWGWTYLRAWKGFGKSISFVEKNGFPSGLLKRMLSEHPGNNYRCQWDIEPILLNGGETLHIGDFHLNIISTPGHCPDHLCLYEPNRKILFSGDHILGDISPNIQCWNYDDDHSLLDFMESLKETAALDVSMVLPGHRGIVRNHRQRIIELLGHHLNRLDEIIGIIDGQMKTAYRVASRMTWDIKADGWEDFPFEQKWFATLEVIAHLKYLENDGKLMSKQKDNSFYYGVNEK